MARAGAAGQAAKWSMARALWSGPGAGALTGVALFAIDLASGEVGFAGLRDPRAIAVVLERARGAAIAEQLTILAVLATVGALFGALGAGCGRAWDRARGRASPRLGGARGVAGALIGHLFFLARGVIVHPQLYSAHLYAQGGVRRRAMMLLTDHVSPRALELGMALLVAGLAFGPLLFTGGRRAARDAIATGSAWVQRRRGVAAILVVASALALATLARSRRHVALAADPARPNLLLIAVDSLRADRVYAPDAAARFPAMAGLARRGVRFRQAFVTQARTFPSFVTLLTGRYSCHHGIRHELPTAAARAAIGPSLPSVLQKAGYRTAVVSDFSGDLFSRTPLGFADIDAPEFNLYSIVREQILNAHLNVLPYAASALGEAIFPTMREIAELDDPDLLADRAIGRLDHLGGRPFFLTVFFSSPHFPYGAPWPYYREFTDPGYLGPYRYLKEPLPQLAAVAPGDARQVQALYDGAVAAADHGIARLLERLDEDGLSRSTIVVLLGDHGEDLFEVPGRGMGHGDHLWGDLDHHIPLVIVDPVHSPSPHDVSGIVRDVDLAPTLAPLFGVTAPPGDGVDLAPLLAGARESLGLDAYAETGLWLLESGPGYRREDRLPYPNVWTATEAAPDGDLFLNPRWEAVSTLAKDRAIRSGSWKLVYQPAPDGAHWRLFDLAADPVEREDVATAHPDVVAELREKLTRFIEADGHTRVVPDAAAR